ncbi:hypothetical protein FJT64_015721 [Amphibalanus amphitrite]|uniref:Uncharacterized protein n=1 Tax=Amphibalanus amphitrite TaxID=1232801 RepID=A0A6A4X226_AMPAM|nr:hypothetical protein FJT64_015721 [Amphibalanus amphitrite]
MTRNGQRTARVDERGGVLRVQRSTSSEVAEAVDEAGAPVFVERVRTQVHSSDSPVGGESPQSERRVPQTSEVEYVDEDFELPEPKTETQTEEYEDEEGRRVVVTTYHHHHTKTVLLEELKLPEPSVIEDVVELEEVAGEVVIYEKIQRRVIRTIYVGEKVVEESEEPGKEPIVAKKTRAEVLALVQKDASVVDVELPEPKTEETTEERIDDEGRRIVTKTVTTTTYEKSTVEDGTIVILEKVQRRIFRTIYVGDEIIEEVEEPDIVADMSTPVRDVDDSGKKEQAVPLQTVAEEIRLPAPSTEEDIVEHTEPDGGKDVSKLEGGA